MSEGKRFLEDCPCCGAPGKLKSVKAYVGFMRGWVGCPACGLYIHWAHDPEGAIRKWNRRDGPHPSLSAGRDVPHQSPAATASPRGSRDGVT